ncbi:MAG: hypothetical protein M1822_005261 [Bathelium mastoideum]|nr:MAG: hypothetical protein M1822_005261 [Bathelium mastoideum]
MNPSLPTYKPLDYYDDYIDFAILAAQDDDFAKVFKAHDSKMDLQDPRALQWVTFHAVVDLAQLLERDHKLYSLKKLPPVPDALKSTKLISTSPYNFQEHDASHFEESSFSKSVPHRYNYVRWIQEILDTTGDDYSDTYDPERQVIGIDIGTGASAIYPLLHTATRPLYRLAATELDAVSHAAAAHNISLNDHLAPRIRLYHPPSQDAPLLDLRALGLAGADFVMCNPPFYASTADLAARAARKAKPPSAVCTGAPVEMIYGATLGSTAAAYEQNPGGDVGFCYRIVEESRGLKERVQWFTCMMGKLESLGQVVERLRSVGVRNWAIGCLSTGKTRRWVVGWSWGGKRPRSNLVRNPQVTIGGVQPFPTEQTLHVNESSVDELWNITVNTLRPLDMRIEADMEKKTIMGFARENVWSRAARRKRARENAHSGSRDEEMKEVEKDQGESDEEEDVALGFKVEARKGSIDIRWLEGMESSLFESFVGMLHRAVLPRQSNG